MQERWSVLVNNPNRDRVRLMIRPDGGEPQNIEIDAAELDELIVALGKARGALRDEVPPSLEPAARLLVTNDPAWKIPAQTDSEHTVLALRHPGFGWLAFGLPDATAEEMKQWLPGPNRRPRQPRSC